MNRRTFFSAAAAGAALAPFESQMQAQDKKPSLFEMTYYLMRSSSAGQAARTSEILSRTHIPALKKAGAGPIGLFRESIGGTGPYFILLTSFESLQAYEAVYGKLSADAEYRKAAEAFYSSPQGPGFERMESRLLMGFPKFPGVVIPPAKEGSRIFELRTYESENPFTLARKVEMFQTGGEIPIFLKSGITPVFFSTTIVGPRIPSLTYMTAFDSLAAREEAWRKFTTDPDWKELRTKPEYSNPGLVSNTTISILSPVAGSDIR